MCLVLINYGFSILISLELSAVSVKEIHCTCKDMIDNVYGN